MGKQNGLGVLHVRHASHGSFQVSFCLGGECTDEGDEGGTNLRCRIDHEKAEIRGDEFIAAATGVEFPAQRAELLHQSLFDEMVDIFGGGRGQPHGIRFGALGNFIERGQCLLHFMFCQDATALQRLSPGAIDGDFIGEQAAIKRKGVLERVEQHVGRFIEAATPKSVIFAFGHFS